MLFRDFFPRLQARALARYGVSLSERQFTNWREKGLIPGPAHPRGRGRGLSPERHWPMQAYRRALRICWYKQRGIDRIPAWWILFWLAGDDVSLDVLRRSLQRELKRVRRQSRYLADSGYIRSDGSTTFEKAPSGAKNSPFSLLLDELIETQHLGISPELYRDFLKLGFDEESSSETGRIFQALVKPLMGHGITPEEVGVSLSAVWRPGHLSDTAHDYVGRCSQGDLVLARQILWEQLRLTSRLAPFAHLLGASRPASILFVVAFAMANRRTGNQRLISDLLQLLYQIADDTRHNLDPTRRLNFILKRLQMMEGDDVELGSRGPDTAI
ncbi:MAG: hypothetical protein Q8K49_02430 [Brevundimonas sp.]|nr:hypothetical protein [Brevundimonas sp.]